MKKATRKTKAEKPQVGEVIAEAVAQERATGTAIFKITKGPETVTPDAYAWLMNPNAIPGAGFAPIRFVGWKVVNSFAETLGRQLDLDEVKMLVQADGNEEICMVDKITFQPVRYAPFVPQSIEASLKTGAKLTEVELYYGGAFYQDDKLEDGRVIAVSGCVYNSRGQHASGSPLVIAALFLGKKKKKTSPVWGESRAHIENRMAERTEGKAQYQRRVDRVEELFTYRRNTPKPLQTPFAKLELKKPEANGAPVSALS